MKRLCAIVVVVMMVMMSSCALAQTDTKSGRVRDEAVRRGMKLIGEDRVRQIASGQIGSENIRIKELKLRNEADDYPDGTNFRPVYKLEALSGYEEYELEIDAVTGKILKYELDD